MESITKIFKIGPTCPLFIRKHQKEAWQQWGFMDGRSSRNDQFIIHVPRTQHLVPRTPYPAPHTLFIKILILILKYITLVRPHAMTIKDGF